VDSTSCGRTSPRRSIVLGMWWNSCGLAGRPASLCLAPYARQTRGGVRVPTESAVLT